MARESWQKPAALRRMGFFGPQAFLGEPHFFIDSPRHRMSLPDAPIAQERFFATHFFTVKDQEKSKDFYVRILGGKVLVGFFRHQKA